MADSILEEKCLNGKFENLLKNGGKGEVELGFRDKGLDKDGRLGLHPRGLRGRSQEEIARILALFFPICPYLGFVKLRNYFSFSFFVLILFGVSIYRSQFTCCILYRKNGVFFLFCPLGWEEGTKDKLREPKWWCPQLPVFKRKTRSFLLTAVDQSQKNDLVVIIAKKK